MIGDQVKTYRLAWGLTQADLAALVNTYGLAWKRTTVSRIELGERDLRLLEALVLTDVLTITLDDLLT